MALESNPSTDATQTKRPMVRLAGVSKTFPGGNQAVRDINLDMQEGEIFTLLGPSGCGKTTTLRLIAGLEEPDHGAIYFRDEAMVDTEQGTFVRANKRSVGMVFQSYAIWPHMTVEENVAYPLKLRGVPRAEIRERVSGALDLVGMPGVEKRPAPLLSGGQQQRVALARALVYEPTVLLLDEPFSNLDAKLRDQMRVEVKLLQHRVKITVIFVTHDQVEALSLSDRIAVMDLGEVQQIGKAGDTLREPRQPVRQGLPRQDRPAERDCLVEQPQRPGGCRAARRPGVRPIRPRLHGRRHSAWKPTCTWPCRPEDIELSEAAGPELPAGMVRGKVEARLFVGERTEYRVSVEEQGSLLVYGRRDQSIDDGKEVWLRPHAQNIGVWPA